LTGAQHPQIKRKKKFYKQEQHKKQNNHKTIMRGKLVNKLDQMKLKPDLETFYAS